jgi:nucleotide-binding universal stress UspA family protein
LVIRRVLLPLVSSRPDLAPIATALATATRLDAHLDAVLVLPDRVGGYAARPEPVPGALSEEVMTLIAADAEMTVNDTGCRFEEACAAAGVPIVNGPQAPGGPSARWLGLWRARELARRARVADLIVLGRPPPGSSDIGLATTIRDTVLISSGRPLLILPPAAVKGAEHRVGHAIAIAWNGSPQVARAVAAAMPFLIRARAVYVVTAETAKTGVVEAERLVEHLQWHGIASQPVLITAAAGEPIGSALLQAAGSAGADLVVMGGHGHSRVHQLLLGGVTRHVFDRAEVPILMAH